MSWVQPWAMRLKARDRQLFYSDHGIYCSFLEKEKNLSTTGIIKTKATVGKEPGNPRGAWSVILGCVTILKQPHRSLNPRTVRNQLDYKNLVRSMDKVVPL